MGKIGVRKALAVLLCAFMLLPLAGALSAQAEQSAEKESPKATKESAQDKKAADKDSKVAEPLPLLPSEKSSAAKGDDAVLEKGVTATGSLEAQAKGSTAPRSADSLNVAQSPANGTLSSGSSALSRGKSPEEAKLQSGSGAVEVVVGGQSESRPLAGTLSTPAAANTKQNTVSQKTTAAAGKAAPEKKAASKPAARPGASNWPPAAPKKKKTEPAAPAAAVKAAVPAAAPASKPVAEAPAKEELLDEQSLADYFAEAEAEAAGEEAGLLESLEAQAEPESGIIPASKSEGNDEAVQADDTLGGLLGGNKSSAVGGSVPRVSPLRSIAIVLACLGLVALGGWVSKKKMGGGFSAPAFPFAQGKQRAMSIVESVSLGQGRQISIVAIKSDALVLGITPQAVTLLDKFPLARLSEDYRGTMEQLIDREDEAVDEASQWRRLRQRQQGEQEQPLEQRRAVGDFAPAPQRSLGESRTISIEDLRRQRGTAGSNTVAGSTRRFGSVSQARSVYGDQASREGLITRIREHLDKLEG